MSEATQGTETGVAPPNAPSAPAAPKPPAPPNLRDSKRQQAKGRRPGGKVVPINNAGKSPGKKAPAKKVAAKATATKATGGTATATLPPRSAANPRYTRAKYTAKAGEKLYQATSRAGKINVRGSATPFTHALDVADKGHPRDDAKAGLIWGFCTSEEQANKAAEGLRVKGYDVVVVAAKEYKAS